MTREEAIAYGKRVIDLGLNDETQAFCELAIKALEQEPEISLEVYKQVAKERDIAIEQLHELGYEFGEKIETKTGHWVKTPKAVMGEGYMWYCDRCEHLVYQDSSRDYPSENYCPNCGADMRGKE